MNRTCMYVPSASGGHAQYARELLTALAQAGGRRYVFELVSSEDLDEQFKRVPYDVNPILPKLRARAEFRNPACWAFNRVTHYARRELHFLRWLESRPDINAVHFQEWTPWLAASMFRRVRLMGKQVFYTVHNVVPHRYPARVPKSVMHRWIRQACRLADGLFVHTELLADQLARFLGPGKLPPINVVPHGVWTVPDAASLPPIQQRMGEKKLLFFGTIRRNKGLDLLLRAAEKLPGYSITVAGCPLDHDYYNNEILPLVDKARAAGAKVDITGTFVPDEAVGPLFRSHGALVMPYTQAFKAQSGVVFMALAYELPVIASEAGGLRDLLNEYKIGTTFTQFTPDALAGAVQALHASASAPELLKQMQAAKERFSWAAAARTTIAGYEAAAAPTTAMTTKAHDCRVATTPAC